MLYFKDAEVSGQRRKPGRALELAGVVARRTALRVLGAAFTGQSLRRGGWPGSSLRRLLQPLQLQPAQGTLSNLPACRSLSSANTLSCVVLMFAERAVGDGGVCSPWPS